VAAKVGRWEPEARIHSLPPKSGPPLSSATGVPHRPAAGLAQAKSKPGHSQPVGNHSDVDRIHIGVVAYQLATG
jgi:hypothetical protein